MKRGIMNPLENKIPPPLVALLTAVMMWAIARDTPAITINNTLRLGLAGALTLVGVLLARAGFRAFGRANTTINPIDIEAASTLVTNGIYSSTRNPMYLGLVAFLLAWAVYLAVPWTLLGPLAFVLFITRFQIIPEERVLLKKFGDAYGAYQRQVRRWI
jgi:protein-S-isoprenylcysteine O-methyltransferase Ste14